MIPLAVGSHFGPLILAKEGAEPLVVCMVIFRRLSTGGALSGWLVWEGTRYTYPMICLGRDIQSKGRRHYTVGIGQGRVIAYFELRVQSFLNVFYLDIDVLFLA